MIMNTKDLRILEFDKIKAKLAELSQTEGAKKKALALEPDCDIDHVKRDLKLTSEAKKLSGIKGMPVFGKIADVRPMTERTVKGAALSPSELLSVASVLRCAASLLDYVRGDRSFETEIEKVFERLIPNRPLEDRIFRAIISEDMIADEASPELSDIRRKMRSVNLKIHDTLQKYVSSSSTSKYLQENIVTTRSGRYVIPVKSEYRNEVKGLVHDISSSGATLFIEPAAVVDANNELRTLESREKHEIERILAELSALVADSADEICLNYLNITDLAFIFAKADLSYKMDAAEPVITEKRRISLIKARHPLLDPKTVVPSSLSLGDDYSLLVITGPNTGGKTVTLKTVGLMAVMAQSGLHIPCDEGSSLCIFDNVFADIGDEQSIEQSLSTFSAHMVGIVGIIEKMTDRSLVLFDELGAGTDPIEGAALAMSILEEVRMSGALCAATTHYAELKSYALETDGVCNAACEFDVDSLRPTYRLIIGAPGKSNAFAISEKLGLPADIVKRASGYVDHGTRNFEVTIAKLEEERFKLQNARRAAEKLKSEAELSAREERTEAEKLLKKAEKELENARKKAATIISGAKASSNYILDELEKVRREKNSKDFEKNLTEAKRNARNKMREASELIAQKDEEFDENYVLPRPLVKGDLIIHRTLKTKGEVCSDPDKNGNCEVQMGIIRSRVNVKDLILDEDGASEKKKAEKKAKKLVTSAASSFKASIDVRGMIGDDAWFTVDKYLDDALLVSVKSVSVIHGKGTGALREALWRRFKTDRRIRSFRAGMYGEGDYGVTVIELK